MRWREVCGRIWNPPLRAEGKTCGQPQSQPHRAPCRGAHCAPGKPAVGQTPAGGINPAPTNKFGASRKPERRNARCKAIPPSRRIFQTAARRRAIPPAVPPPFDKGGKTAANPAANRKPNPAAQPNRPPCQRGREWRSGDCPAAKCRFIQATVNRRKPHRHAASFKRQPAVRQSLRHGLRPCHLPLTREAKPPQTLRPTAKICLQSGA